MDMRKLVAKEFIVDLLGLVDFSQGLGHVADLLDQLSTFGRCEMEQLGSVALKDDDCPSRKELVVMEIGFGQFEIRYEIVWLRPSPEAEFAGLIAHGLVAFFHSSSVTTPFLISN